jgi:hypothetical protein
MNEKKAKKKTKRNENETKASGVKYQIKIENDE